MQSEIARTIADQLQAKLSRDEKSAIDKPATNDLQAYDLYLRARVLANDTTSFTNAQLNLPRAEEFLKEAVKRDPNFLLAWCLLAEVHALEYWKGFDHTPARLDQANSAVQTALRIQPDSGEEHLALAVYCCLTTGKFRTNRLHCQATRSLGRSSTRFGAFFRARPAQSPTRSAARRNL
jgi:tetratricopeptide (TPR) repeat protein